MYKSSSFISDELQCCDNTWYTECGVAVTSYGKITGWIFLQIKSLVIPNKLIPECVFEGSSLVTRGLCLWVYVQ